MSPDTLEAVGVNELFVAVTVDASFNSDRGEDSTNCWIRVPLTDL